MTALVAEAFFGQGFFRTLFFLALAFVWGFALFDLAKSHISGWHKAIWLLAIIFIPVIGSFAYLITRPSFAIETDRNPIDDQNLHAREREETAIGMTHRSSS
jgi:hypothetical protein